MRKKRILVIAAGEWQLPVIRKAQSMGLEVVATDRNPLAPGLEVADYPEVVDITDLQATLRVAEKYKVDAVITEQTDMSVPTAAYVAEKLGLPGIGYEVALSVTNKWLMREKCKKAGIPGPEYRKVANLDQAKKAANEIGFPVVVKPVDGQASRGVARVDALGNLEEYYRLAKEHSREGSVLVEQCMSGVESTAEGFVNDGDFHVLAISDKKHLPPPVCVAISLTYPPDFTNDTINEIVNLDVEVMRTLNIPMGITHGEYMVTENGPKLIEMSARGGGSRISSHIVPAVSGVHVIEGLILQGLGQRFVVESGTSNAAILAFFVLPRGKVRKVCGVEQARAIEGVMEVRFEVGPGDSIGVVDNDRARHGFFIAVGRTRGEVLKIAERVKETVKVELEAGNVR